MSSVSRAYSRMFVPARAGEMVVWPQRSSLTPLEVRKSTRGNHIPLGESSLPYTCQLAIPTGGTGVPRGEFMDEELDLFLYCVETS